MGEVVQTGLTIREHFAALAMQGLMAADGRNGETWQVGRCAARAVQEADALIAELAKPTTEPQTFSYRERVARAVVSAATGRAFTSDAEVPVEIGAGELKQLVLIAMEQIKP
jgi:hypothetical protein